SPHPHPNEPSGPASSGARAMSGSRKEKPMSFPDRIKEFRRVRADELLPDPRNWRRHPEAQRRALRAVLEQIGMADALLAREVSGHLVLIDGHLRRGL